MPTEDPLTIATEAKHIAEEALKKADEAINVAEGAKASVAGLAHAVKRCEDGVSDVKRKMGEDHAETMAAIKGAATTDTAQAEAIAAVKAAGEKQSEEIKAIKGDISNTAIGKIVGSLVLVISAIAGLIHAITTAAPAVLQAHYGQPAVVVTAAPAGSK